MTAPLRALVTLLLLGGLAGCGQSGPLYLPGNPSDMREIPPPTENAEEDDEDKPDDEG